MKNTSVQCTLNEYNVQIEKIESLLLDEEYLNSYIENVEKSNVVIPNNLNQNIISKINESKNIKDPGKPIFKFTDILKIAVCTIVAVSIWNVSITIERDPDNNMIAKSYGNVPIDRKIDNVSVKINDFFMKPVNFEGGGK